MNCSQHDLKAFFLGELPPQEREQVEAHLTACPACRQELARLETVRAALLSQAPEQPPQRIAFVSDKVFEPGFWARLWNSTARLAFASAAMLSLALLVHALLQPQPPAAPSPLEVAAIEERIRSELSRTIAEQIQAAVSKATAEQLRHASALVAAAEQRCEARRQADLVAFAEALEMLQKRMNVYRASLTYGGAQ